ncbi:MAG: cupin domain-containing protein [Steroidobacteraceae bacterium]
MNRTVAMLAITLATGIAGGLLASRVLIAKQPVVTRTLLQQADLEGVAGRQVAMYTAQVVPGAASGRHYNSGPEFVYVLQGSLTFEFEGHAPVTVKVGESEYVPAKNIHIVKNASATEPAKSVVFWVLEKGQPFSIPVK